MSMSLAGIIDPLKHPTSSSSCFSDQYPMCSLMPALERATSESDSLPVICAKKESERGSSKKEENKLVSPCSSAYLCRVDNGAIQSGMACRPSAVHRCASSLPLSMSRLVVGRYGQ